ncbi:Leucine-rich repeat receptor-like protein kinase [Actinidia chinensis var. chinensis]|uniref:non-specific serine/threonine protein kinase n=1 Tax=Actinidia chinensis var. chinensis TaxID=1590841 RepID=A0A2R6PTU1_ACTCC|nr:Leucine-rich repeat receptor-like protein kinase [Actinidia chinensis var. chinensis]
MRIAMKILYLFLSSSALILLVHGQPGFISIDCGIAEGSQYNDEKTLIEYSSDKNFVDTGENMDIASEFKSQSRPKQLWNVRSFPEGNKSCYNLVPEEGKDNKYLIRASFFYGNYDSKDEAPEFKLYLGVEEWDLVKFNNISEFVFREIIHVPSTDYIDVCLVNIGSGTPFISALELRKLNNSIYVTKPSESFLLYNRLDFGSETNEIVRYQNDEYDRIWKPFNFYAWEPIRAAYISDSLSDNIYRPPNAAMRTAVKPINSSEIIFYWTPDNADQKFYVYLHFAEVESLAAGESRTFSISINGNFFDGPYTPVYLEPLTVWNLDSLGNTGAMYCKIYKVEGSTQPPILNAAEIYVVKDFKQSPTDQDDVNAIKNIKSAYKLKRNWQGDPCVPTQFLWVGLTCSDNVYNPSNITSLDLSSSQLTGKIDPSFAYLKSLQYLDLSNNSLTGPVPDFLTELHSLKTLNLIGNKLTGSVPPVLIERYDKGDLSLRLDKNSGLCWPNSCKKRNVVVPVVASILSFVGLLLGVGMLWILRRRRHAGFVSKLNGDGPLEPKNRHFSYSELVSITNDFHKVIGKGGFGTVYGGLLEDGTQVAVKMLSPSSTQGSKQFQTEAQLLTRVHHRNLALLIGYCDEGSNMGLIYEYMANGNLQEHLSGAGNNKAVLTWKQRLRIAIDAAQAFEYLHNGCRPPIIHRDVKTANILLNENLQAKVADFGLSRILPFESGTHASTTVAGTFGYLDPEYYISNRLNEKSDVYSFGIVLLELITGQPAILKSHNSTHIVQWINPILARGEIESIIDPKLRGDFDINSVWKAVETAMACVPSSSIQRPTMSQVLVELKECLEIETACESTWTSRKDQETSTSSFEMVALDIESSISIGPQAR